MSLEQVSKHNLGEAVAGRRRENMGELGLKPCCKAQANSSASHLVPDTPGSKLRARGALVVFGEADLYIFFSIFRKCSNVETAEILKHCTKAHKQHTGYIIFFVPRFGLIIDMGVVNDLGIRMKKET